MIYSIIIWLAVKSDKGGRGVSLYQIKYDVICVTALIYIFIFLFIFIFSFPIYNCNETIDAAQIQNK
jgi:hypothetical protein